MKVISIRQPYAWLIFNGGKSIENRSWGTSYTGPLLIQAGKALYPDADGVREWWNNLVTTQTHMQGYPQMPELDDLPKGAIVGKARLVGCYPFDKNNNRNPWATGPWCWYLSNRKALPPLPMRGMQGLFNLRETLPAEYLELAA